MDVANLEKESGLLSGRDRNERSRSRIIFNCPVNSISTLKNHFGELRLAGLAVHKTEED